MSVRELTWLPESTPRLPPNSRRSSVIADGSKRKCLLRWRSSASREPMPWKATGRRAVKPTTISSPLGKTRTRISRYSAKPKPNTRNSPQPHLPPLRHQGKSNRRGFHKWRSSRFAQGLPISSEVGQREHGPAHLFDKVAVRIESYL